MIKLIRGTFLTIIILSLISSITIFSKNVSVIGTGYVGLIAGSGLAKLGHNVICADIDRNKINNLIKGQMPIYEPGLEQIVKKNVRAGRLTFTNNVDDAIKNSDVVIVAVGTPMSDNGEADLKYLESAMDTIVKNLNGYKVVCIKSTVPIGTNKKMKDLVNKYKNGSNRFDIVSNPEFLRAGNALKDFFEDNPIVLGSDSKKALTIMEDLYAPLKENGIPFITGSFETAEMTKYASNCWVAIKVAYANELARLANECGADIFKVMKGIGDVNKVRNIGDVKPGPGYGGSCLPKDTRAFVAKAKDYGIDLKIIKAVIESNKVQKIAAVRQLYNLLNGSVRGKNIGVLGLSFKANTDDIRKSPAIDVIQKLKNEGAHIRVYDPQAAENMRRLFPAIKYCDSIDQVAKNADALIILTGWKQIKDMNLQKVAKQMKKPVIVDSRNLFNPADLEENGFSFSNFGRRGS